MPRAGKIARKLRPGFGQAAESHERYGAIDFGPAANCGALLRQLSASSNASWKRLLPQKSWHGRKNNRKGAADEIPAPARSLRQPRQIPSFEKRNREKKQIVRLAWRGRGRGRDGRAPKPAPGLPCPHRLAKPQMSLGKQQGRGSNGTGKLAGNLIEARSMPLTGQLQPKINEVEPSEVSPCRRVIRVLTDPFFQVCRAARIASGLN